MRRCGAPSDVSVDPPRPRSVHPALPFRLPGWRWNRLPLTSRLTALLLAVGLTPLFVAQMLALSAYQRRIVTGYLDDAEQLADNKVRQIQAELTSKGIELDELARAADGQPERLRRDWAQRAARLGFRDLLLVDASGPRVVASVAESDLAGQRVDQGRLRDSGLFRAVDGVRLWSQVSVVPLDRIGSSGEVAAWMAVPLRPGDRRGLLLAGRLDASAFQDVVASRFERHGHGARVALVTEERQGAAVPAADSAAGAANSDTITDFNGVLGDRLNLAAIDANALRSGNQSFRFIEGRPFSGRPGEVRFAAGLLQVNTNSSRRAEMEILLSGVTSLSGGVLNL